MATEALARNYEMYRRQVLDRLGVQYYDEDIEDFDRWRLKVLQGLKDLYGEENIINSINAWLDEHTINFSGATDSEEGEAGLVPPTTLGSNKRPARAHYHLNADGDWVVDAVWGAYTSGYDGSEKIKLKIPNTTGTASYNIEAIGTGQKGTAGGVCPLDENGKVDRSYLNGLTGEYDFETTLTPTINSNGIVSQLFKIVPKDLTAMTLKDTLKISAYLYNTGISGEQVIPLIVTRCALTSSGYIPEFKCILSSPQGTGNTTSGKLHIVAPFEIDSVTSTM